MQEYKESTTLMEMAENIEVLKEADEEIKKELSAFAFSIANLKYDENPKYEEMQMKLLKI